MGEWEFYLESLHSHQRELYTALRSRSLTEAVRVHRFNRKVKSRVKSRDGGGSVTGGEGRGVSGRFSAPKQDEIPA